MLEDDSRAPDNETRQGELEINKCAAVLAVIAAAGAHHRESCGRRDIILSQDPSATQEAKSEKVNKIYLY